MGFAVVGGGVGTGEAGAGTGAVADDEVVEAAATGVADLKGYRSGISRSGKQVISELLE